MTKTTTKYGIYGVAAIAAILSISLIATAMNAPSAQAVPANKVGWVEYNTNVAASWDEGTKGQTTQYADYTLGPYEIHTSDKNDWLVTFWAECATYSEVQATGKKGAKSDTTGAQAGASATLYYTTDDGIKVLESWRICQEDLRIEADLNALIEFVPGLNCDEEANPGCGSLQFVCDEFLDKERTIPNPLFLTEDCQQWVKVYLGLAGSYSAAWVIMNMDAGHHELYIEIDMDAGPSGPTGDTGALDDEPNGIKSMVTIGNKIFVAEPIHIAQQDPLQ